ncbi:MAG: hypothetical protein Q4P34_05715 [Tissierellia bacterium]|nr:hypothetical protein [Tissierellia bacterium]
MALPIKNIKKLHKSLEYNFLYNNDLNSMHLLLAMLENEVRLKKLRPKYICMNSIKRSFMRTLKYRRDRDLIIRTVNKLINDDINRLELSVYIDSYSSGYQSDYWVNKLESLAFKTLPVEDICQKSILFHEAKNPDVLKLRNELNDYLDSDKIRNERIKRITFTYCEKVIKKKIYSINENLDRQLMISYNDSDKIVSDEEFLTIPELTNLYQKLMTSYIKSITRIYRSSYWYGINDRVLNRY